MKKWRLIGLAGVLCLASSCSNEMAAPPNSEPLAASETTQPENSSAEAGQALGAKDFFPDPLVANASTLKPVAGTNLIPPTTSAERVPQIEAGRNDPFASLGFTPTVVAKPAAQPVAAQPVAVNLPAPVVQPIPLEPPALPVLPVPAVEVPRETSRSAPVSPAPSLAEAIEITGVVQVAGVTNVIVKAPDEHTSRPVAVGERLGNGKVLVKRVEMGLEPTVILEQGGREIVRSIGSSNALIGAL